MSKQENPLCTETVSGMALAQHLGVSRNNVPSIVAKFGLRKAGKGYRPADVFRNVHGIEPMLLPATLARLQAKHSRTVESDNADDADNAKAPRMVCLVDEIADITDLARMLWDDGLVHITDFAAEYGYAYDTFRKKLKAGTIDLPPVSPIVLTTNRVMYRPLEVFLWRRHGIALDLPQAAAKATDRGAPSPFRAKIPDPVSTASPGRQTDTVFAAAIAATDEKSDFQAAPDRSADTPHKTRP
jgi:hypothetical protein